MANEPEMPNFPANEQTTPRIIKPARVSFRMSVCNSFKRYNSNMKLLGVGGISFYICSKDLFLHAVSVSV